MTARFAHIPVLFLSAMLLAACSDGGDNAIGSGSGGSTGGGDQSGQGADGGGTTGADSGTTMGTVGNEPPIAADSTFFYFSYDESASTASRDLSLFALDSNRRPAPDLGRPYEFLNAERFAEFDAQAAGPFQVSMTMRRAERGDLPVAGSIEGRLYALGVDLAGPTQTVAERRNVVLTVLIDVSGSMQSAYASETRSDVTSLLDVVKYGLTRVGPSLKTGDVLNLVTFSTDANVIAEGIDATSGAFESAVASLGTEASTDIGRGVALAYDVANRTFDQSKANRVLMLTDARVNTGELDPDVIARATKNGDLEGILFSAIGVGSNFDDRVLNTISDAGRGSYSAMITPNDAERLFTSGFSRFISPAATDVRFRLDYPQSLNQLRSFGEEISTNPEDVQPVNFSYGSKQFFLELFEGSENIDGLDVITLTIDYTDLLGEERSTSVTRSLDQLIATTTDSLDAAFAVTTLAELIGGRIDCETVQASRLYQQPVQNATYALYRQNIERFCEQIAPYDYVYR